MHLPGALLLAAALLQQQPLPPPADWAAGITRGDILYRGSPASDGMDVRLLPSIGNGFIATLAGSGNTCETHTPPPPLPPRAPCPLHLLPTTQQQQQQRNTVSWC